MDVKSSFLPQIRSPKMSGKELVCINLAFEYMGTDGERQLSGLLPPYLPSRIERCVNNRRKLKLFPLIERIWCHVSEEFNRFEEVYVVDSMPLVCKLFSSSRSKVCREQVHSSPNKGYCTSQGANYYGYKLHAVCSANGVFKSLDIGPASAHYVNYLKDIRHYLSDRTLLRDRGYLSAEWRLDLLTDCDIKLDIPLHHNQTDYRQQPYIFKRTRKRIETLFSQLCDQSMIRRNYAKTLEGLKTRILSKITASNTVQYINIGSSLAETSTTIKINIAYMNHGL